MQKTRQTYRKPGLSGLFDSLLESTLQYLVVEDGHAYIYDPYFDLKRSRVTAEVCKSMMRAGRSPDITEKMTRWLVSRQNPDGSWNEEHPRYSKPSALVTSFVAETLLLKKLTVKLTEIEERSLRSAARYVLHSEIGPGYFRKSASYLADYLNVDASCGAFLAEYGQAYDDPACMEAAVRAAVNCIAHQAPDGMYPYAIIGGSEPDPLNVPCVHYQGVTMYYLIKVQQCVHDSRVESSLRRAASWLEGVQRMDGSFDWSRSGLMFAYYLSGAYAFAAVSFDYCGLAVNRDVSVAKAGENAPGIMWRWEQDSFLTLPRDIHTTYRSSMLGSLPVRYRLVQLGYGLYRQCARRRHSDRIDAGLFNILSKAFHKQASTIDPFANYPDLFMTSETLDCLGYMLYGAGQVLEAQSQYINTIDIKQNIILK